MGPLTYKVFNLYSFIQCETYNSHLYTTLPLKCESINSSCSPSSGSSYLLVSPLLVSNEALIPLLSHWGKPGGLSTSRLEQPYKKERCHTLTKNLKAMSLWVLLLIRCSTFTLLSDVRHITHTCTQQNQLLFLQFV